MRKIFSFRQKSKQNSKNPTEMSTHKFLPKLEFMSSLNSDDDDHSMQSDEQNKLLKFEKLKQYHNITKYEQLNNSAGIAVVNRLQDAEINELLKKVNNLIFMSLERIHQHDAAFHVELDNFAPKTTSTKTHVDADQENKNLKHLNQYWLMQKNKVIN